MPGDSLAIPPGPHFLYEKTKGSAIHYQNMFPDDSRLAAWAKNLKIKPT
jgi:hypothetical protein